MHGVYKYEVDGKVIYVGKTDSNFESRITCHKRDSIFAPYLPKAKIFVQELKDAKEADFIETLLISQYKPKLNVKKKRVTDLEVCAVLDWVLWDDYDMERQINITIKKRPQKSTYALYLPDETMKKVKAAAKKSDLSVSEIVAQALSEVFK